MTPHTRTIVVGLLVIGLLGLAVLVLTSWGERERSPQLRGRGEVEPVINGSDPRSPGYSPDISHAPDDTVPQLRSGDPDALDDVVTVPVKWIHAPLDKSVSVRLVPADVRAGQAQQYGTLQGLTFLFRSAGGTRYVIVPPSEDVIILARELVLSGDGKGVRVVSLAGPPTDHIQVIAASRVTLVTDCPADWPDERNLSVQMISRDAMHAPPIGATLSLSLKSGISETLLIPRHGVHFQMNSDEYYLKGTTPHSLATIEDGQTITLHFAALVPLLIEVYEEKPGAWLELLREEAHEASGPSASHAVLSVSVVAKDRSGKGGTVGHPSVKRPLAEIVASGGVVDRFEVPVAVPVSEQMEYSILVRAVFSGLGVVAAGIGRIGPFNGRPTVRVEAVKTHPEIRVLVVDQTGAPIAGIPIEAGVEYIQDEAGYRRFSSGGTRQATTDAGGLAVFRGTRASSDSVFVVTIQSRLKVLDSPGRITIKDALVMQTLKFVLELTGGSFVVDLEPSISGSRARLLGGANELLLFPRDSTTTEPLTRKLPTPVTFPVVYMDIPVGLFDPILLLDGVPYSASSVNVSGQGETKLVIRPRAEGVTTIRFTPETTGSIVGAQVLPISMPVPLAWGVLREARRAGGSRVPIFKLDASGEVNVPWAVASEDVDHWMVEFAESAGLATPTGATRTDTTTIQASLRALPAGTVQVQLRQLEKSHDSRFEVGVSPVSREDKRVWTVNMHWGTVFPVAEDSVEITTIPEGEYTLFVILRKGASVTFLPDEKYRSRIVVRRGETTIVRFPR
jgi:hypothetical protein